MECTICKEEMTNYDPELNTMILTDRDQLRFAPNASKDSSNGSRKGSQGSFQRELRRRGKRRNE